jgi:Ca-activated chloride channel family protein
MINYFDYDYPQPDSRQPPFRVSTELAPTPWNPKTLLLAVGIKGYDVPKTQLPPANLVFLIDVSGSMNSPDKIGLLKPALKLLTRQLRPEDKVAIAVYAGAAGMVLEPTPGNQKAKIEAALDRLSAGGSTNGGAGIQLAYNLARDGFVKGGVNRVILATDGDFNVGTVNFEALKNLVETQRKSGIALTTLGFRNRQLQRPVDGATGRRRQRQLRLHRHLAGSQQGAGRADERHPADHRQGRENPDRIQSGAGRGIPADRLRKPGVAARGFQQ